jgi:hypothetical protein
MPSFAYFHIFQIRSKLEACIISSRSIVSVSSLLNSTFLIAKIHLFRIVLRLRVGLFRTIKSRGQLVVGWFLNLFATNCHHLKSLPEILSNFVSSWTTIGIHLLLDSTSLMHENCGAALQHRLTVTTFRAIVSWTWTFFNRLWVSFTELLRFCTMPKLLQKVVLTRS